MDGPGKVLESAVRSWMRLNSVKKKSLSHGPSPGSLAGDPFGVKMETIERKLQNNIIKRTG
jgi:hypothetical protein